MDAPKWALRATRHEHVLPLTCVPESVFHPPRHGDQTALGVLCLVARKQDKAVIE